MTRGGAAVLVAALASGCGSLQPNDAGVANLEVHSPACDGIELGTTLDLEARTFDQHGDSIDAPVWWRSPDTTVDVDSATGRTTGLLISDTARVQAVVGSKNPLISDFIPLVVTPAADTLAQSSAARITVDSGVTASQPLVVTVSKKSPETPVKSFPLVFRVIAPVFAGSDLRTVEFPGGKLSLTLCSGASGAASTTLNRRANQAQPDSAVVEVTARHPDGSTVPGSGWRYTVLFAGKP